MSVLERFDLSGWKGLFWFGVALVAANKAPCKEDEMQLDEIRRLGT